MEFAYVKLMNDRYATPEDNVVAQLVLRETIRMKTTRSDVMEAVNFLRATMLGIRFTEKKNSIPPKRAFRFK
jgi:hypothetical protein